ncbi:hypothetical protein GQ44DRAFT_699076 [Phaeosphaeriaceae sp. PMI808]|nr:hypothetical protein GQ44DRAFT_699076 [Phaeosphaeriaceae sp. PMI808]
MGTLRMDSYSILATVAQNDGVPAFVFLAIKLVTLLTFPFRTLFVGTLALKRPWQKPDFILYVRFLLIEI